MSSMNESRKHCLSETMAPACDDQHRGCGQALADP